MARIDIAEIHNFVTVFIAESKRVQMELDHKKTAIGHFLSDSEIQGNIGDQAKAYYRDVYYPLLDGTKTCLIDAEECLKKYISDFHAQVDPSANAKLDLARMYELQADMRKYENKIENLKANVNSTANSMASIGKNIGLQLGMETALGNFRREEQILENYEQFEATHRNVLRDVLEKLHQVKQSLAQIESGVAFDASSHTFHSNKIKLGALEPKKAKKSFNFDKYDKTLQGSYWVLTKNGKTDADCAEATIAYNQSLANGSVKPVKTEQEDIDAKVMKAAIGGIYYYTDEPISKVQSFSIITGIIAGAVVMRNKGIKVPKTDFNEIQSNLLIKNGAYNSSKNVPYQTVKHANIGDFNTNNRIINGGHGQDNISYLKKNGIEFNVLKEYPNGVRIGNIPSHKNKFKRTGEGQAWFPDNWSEKQIFEAGDYIAKLPSNANLPDGIWTFSEYKGVRVGIIKTDGKVGTIIPDNSRQP